MINVLGWFGRGGASVTSWVGVAATYPGTLCASSA
jgi:hypothetical protein